jgi:hypothetical protein
LGRREGREGREEGENREGGGEGREGRGKREERGEGEGRKGWRYGAVRKRDLWLYTFVLLPGRINSYRRQLKLRWHTEAGIMMHQKCLTVEAVSKEDADLKMYGPEQVCAFTFHVHQLLISPHTPQGCFHGGTHTTM